MPEESKELREQLIIARGDTAEDGVEISGETCEREGHLLKDCLERLHAALRAGSSTVGKYEPGLMSRQTIMKQNHLVAKTAAEVAEAKWQKLFLPRRSTISWDAYDAPERSSECS